MELLVGIIFGAAVVYAVIAFAIRNPTPSRQKRSSTDHGGWNDTNSNSSYWPPST